MRETQVILVQFEEKSIEVEATRVTDEDWDVVVKHHFDSEAEAERASKVLGLEVVNELERRGLIPSGLPSEFKNYITPCHDEDGVASEYNFPESNNKWVN